MRDFAELNESLSPAPRWGTWRYPGADSPSSVLWANTSLNGKLVRLAGHAAVFLTTDSFEDVARYYAEKAGFEDADDDAKSRGVASSHGNSVGESTCVLDDCRDPTDLRGSRAVRAKCLMRRSPSFVLTVFLTRTDAENHTHILVAYDPKTELSLDSASR